jgi:hypothetical protein
MPKYDAFDNKTNKLINIFEDIASNKNEISEESAKRTELLSLFKDAKIYQNIIAKIKDSSTIFEPLEFLEEDGEIQSIYKTWEIPILSISEEDLETLSTIIIPYISYRIIYESPTALDVDFYSNEFNLKETSFFEVKGDTLYLRISVYMEKYFDSADLTVPIAKILIKFKNPFEVLK